MLELGNERVLYVDADGPLIDSDQRAVDLVGDAISSHATMIAMPVSRLGSDFCQLRSGLAGAIVHRVVIYHLKLAIIGDITEHLATSNAFRDWMGECNRGDQVCFLPDLDDLATRLSNMAPPG